MNAGWTLVPFLLVRFVLLGLLDKTALKRAAFFPPRAGNEKAAYAVYQTANISLVLYLFFLKISDDNPLLSFGLVLYAFGMAVILIAAINFARPGNKGINSNGLYRISRNPMYIGYFIFFLGFVLLTRSVVLLALLIAFQLSAHWIILAEERWCMREFGEEYIKYMKKVRRYL